MLDGDIIFGFTYNILNIFYKLKINKIIAHLEWRGRCCLWRCEACACVKEWLLIDGR
jgi:hypothetical protein